MEIKLTDEAKLYQARGYYYTYDSPPDHFGFTEYKYKVFSMRNPLLEVETRFHTYNRITALEIVNYWNSMNSNYKYTLV